MIWNCAYDVKDDQAFIYLVLFPELNLKYIGSKKVDKNGKWKNYTTSSKKVNQLIANGEQSYFMMLSVFDNWQQAQEYEYYAQIHFSSPQSSRTRQNAEVLKCP